MSTSLQIGNLTPEGATELAGKINDFWRHRGLDPQARVDRQSIKKEGDDSRTAAVYVVRSNMVNGVPVRRLG
jgi:hypothetical protein